MSLGDIAVVYRHDIEQLLVLLPQGIAGMAAIVVPSSNTKQEYRGAQLDFNLNINLPPPCTTGYLPPTQRRSPASVDAPDRPAAELYCRVPQDSDFNVRGVRNIPCEAKPWKRAPTVEICESDEEYVPLNEGYNWKGDPNATTRVRAYRSIRRDRIRDYHRHGAPRRPRRRHRSPLPPMTRPTVTT